MPDIAPHGDSPPLFVRAFNAFMSSLALVAGGGAVIVLAFGLAHVVSARGAIVVKALFAAILLTMTAAILVAARGIWLGARPHADATTKRLRKLYLVLWLAGVGLMGTYWLLLSTNCHASTPCH